MPKWFVPVLLVSLCMFALGVAGLVVVSGMSSDDTSVSDDDPYRQAQGLDSLTLLDFQLFDQTGAIVDRSIFDRQVTILSFFFTNCQLVCPLMTGQMYGIADALGDTDVRFVSISVDPEHDTIDVIREYAKRYDADPDRWRFLTGDRDQVVRLVGDGMRFHLANDTNDDNQIALTDGSTMPNIIHPSQFFLIGPDRRVLGLYSYLIEEDVEELTRRARVLSNLD